MKFSRHDLNLKCRPGETTPTWLVNQGCRAAATVLYAVSGDATKYAGWPADRQFAAGISEAQYLQNAWLVLIPFSTLWRCISWSGGWANFSVNLYAWINFLKCLVVPDQERLRWWHEHPSPSAEMSTRKLPQRRQPHTCSRTPGGQLPRRRMTTHFAITSTIPNQHHHRFSLESAFFKIQVGSFHVLKFHNNYTSPIFKSRKGHTYKLIVFKIIMSQIVWEHV